MKVKIIVCCAFFIGVFPTYLSANSAPEVNNVTASQRTDGSKLVDIYYDVNDADGDLCTIWVKVSDDGGSSWDVNAVSLTGDIGVDITPGTGKHIIWDCGTDLPGAYGTNYKVRVYADDGYTPIPPDMVYISGGTFQMGDSFSENWPVELPVHTVTLDSFYMGKYEVTNQHYRDYLNSAYDACDIKVDGGIVYAASDSSNSHPYCDMHSYDVYSQIDYNDVSGTFSVRTKGGRDMSNDPMLEISWYGCVAYCNWRGQQEGKEQCYNLSMWACDFNKHGYHLATEAEWEYAARGGMSGKRFPWADPNITHSQANYYSWWEGGSPYYPYDVNPTEGFHATWNDGIYPYTSPVGSFSANGFDLYDMAGNVLEWCNDWYSSTYYSSSPPNNPTGPTSGPGRVLRGGGWYTNAVGCRVANRGVGSPEARVNLAGFRVVLDLNTAIGWADSGLFTIANRDIWYVDDDAAGDPCHGNPDYSDPNEDGSPEHPFDAIQEGIDVAFGGDTIIVLSGTYRGMGNRNLNLNGKAVTVRSTDPTDPCIVNTTVIDCEGKGRGFVFKMAEDADSKVAGLTITNGYGMVGGAIYSYNDSSPSITNCVIRNNSAVFGGGIACANGESHPVITYCQIIANSALFGGGGVYLNGSSPIIKNSIVSGNFAAEGGAICSHYPGNPLIVNCTISANAASDLAGAVYCYNAGNLSLNNCILWGDTAPYASEILVGNLGAPTSIQISYCDIQGGEENVVLDTDCTVDWGDGNIDADPCFVNPDGNDFHLLPDSPCIDAGDPCYVASPDETDIDGNPRIINGRVDIGADETNYQPDLVVTSEDITFGVYPAVPGEPNSILATVWNTGESRAENIEVSFTDSSGPIGSNTIPRLDPGQSETVSIQHSWPDTGYQLITVAVDPADNIEELDETNNTASKVYQIGYPADANAILDVSWNSAPACYTEGTTAIIRGKADYRIEISGAPDIVSPALGSIVTAQIIDSNGVVTNLQSTLTGPDGYFYIPFSVPGQAGDSFTIEISVTDGTLTGVWEKLFCVRAIDTTKKDLWICELTVSNDTPDLGDTVTVCAAVCAAPDNNDTVLNIPVTFYAYPPPGGVYQIDSNTIDQMAPGDSNTVCVDWTPTVNGLHRIKAILGPGYSDDNNGNNYKYYDIVVGMFNITASPKWAVVGQQVQITVDSREPLPSDQLDSIAVLDGDSQPIPFSPADPCHPSPTRWIYQTDPLSIGTSLGTATITVAGTDSSSVQHTCQGYFEVYETMPDFWLHSCDISFSYLNPALGEPITIDAVVHADSSNPESIPDIPVTFYSKHLPSNGDYIKISQTQYTDGILPGGVSTPVSVPWQNAAKGEYVIKVQLGPGFSDRNNGNNAATRAILVGDDIPFDVDFEVVNKTRTGRTEFEYECNVRMYNQTGLTLENVQLELTGVSSNMTLVTPYTATFASIGPNGSALSENICTFSVDRAVEIDSAQINWHLTYQIVNICGIMQQTSSSTIILGSESDITGEGDVDTADLARLAEKWLWTGTPGSIDEDIAPQPDGDGIINFLDFAVLAENWLAGVE